MLGEPSFPHITKLNDEEILIEPMNKQPREPESNRINQTNINLEPPFPERLTVQKHHSQAQTKL